MWPNLLLQYMDLLLNYKGRPIYFTFFKGADFCLIKGIISCGNYTFCTAHV
jgi:hypothetical protein